MRSQRGKLLSKIQVNSVLNDRSAPATPKRGNFKIECKDCLSDVSYMTVDSQSTSTPSALPSLKILPKEPLMQLDRIKALLGIEMQKGNKERYSSVRIGTTESSRSNISSRNMSILSQTASLKSESKDQPKKGIHLPRLSIVPLKSPSPRKSQFCDSNHNASFDSVARNEGPHTPKSRLSRFQKRTSQFVSRIYTPTLESMSTSPRESKREHSSFSINPEPLQLGKSLSRRLSEKKSSPLHRKMIHNIQDVIKRSVEAEMESELDQGFNFEKAIVSSQNRIFTDVSDSKGDYEDFLSDRHEWSIVQSPRDKMIQLHQNLKMKRIQGKAARSPKSTKITGESEEEKFKLPILYCVKEMSEIKKVKARDVDKYIQSLGL